MHKQNYLALQPLPGPEQKAEGLPVSVVTEPTSVDPGSFAGLT